MMERIFIKIDSSFAVLAFFYLSIVYIELQIDIVYSIFPMY